MLHKKKKVNVPKKERKSLAEKVCERARVCVRNRQECVSVYMCVCVYNFVRVSECVCKLEAGS